MPGHRADKKRLIRLINLKIEQIISLINFIQIMNCLRSCVWQTTLTSPKTTRVRANRSQTSARTPRLTFKLNYFKLDHLRAWTIWERQTALSLIESINNSQRVAPTQLISTDVRVRLEVSIWTFQFGVRKLGPLIQSSKLIQIWIADLE